MFATSPKLIAGSYVLHRLQLPRHPPYALTRLTIQHKLARFLMHLSIFIEVVTISPDRCVKIHTGLEKIFQYSIITFLKSS